MKQKLLKSVGIIGLGLSLMGNEGCEQAPVVEQRILKWYADAGSIKSPPINFGEGAKFDFGYVASEQLHGVLYNSKGFTSSYKGPGIMMSQRGPVLAGAEGMYQKAFGTQTVGNDLYFSAEARCLIHLPDIKIDGNVLSYEMNSGNNITIGFNQLIGAINPNLDLGARFRVTVRELAMQIRGMDIAKDLYTGAPKTIGSPIVRERSRDVDGQIDLNYNQIKLGYGWYNSTPLATVTERALNSAVDIIKDEMNKVKWSTKILDLKPFGNETNPFGDLGYVIKGGADVNLKQGDLVEFYQDITIWSGKPCESNFNGYQRVNPRPIAVGEVIFVDRNFSTVAINQRFDDRKILPGWRVQLLERVEDKAR